MKRENRARVEELYHAALARGPAEQIAYLERACAGDAELLAEVLSLLRPDEAGRGFPGPRASDAVTQRAAAVTQTISPERPPPGSPLFVWGHLDVLERIGEGGFGEVYRAWDRQLEREVALKLLKPSHAHSAQSRRSAVREGRLLARIKNPHVVTVHGADDREGRVGIWMELLSGRSLEQLLQERGPLSDHEAIVIGIDLCRALSAVHRQGIVHGDLKSDNVIREDGGRLVLMDFGIGVDLASEPGPPRAGTLPYMAPELLEGSAPSVASDLYALGVLLHLLVSGRVPPRDAGARRGGTPGGGLRDLRSGLSQPFLRVVERALDPDPARRFASAGSTERALAHALAASGENPLLAPSAPPPPAERDRVLALGGLAAAVLGVAVVVWLWPEPAPRSAARSPAAEPRPLTSYPGVELQPALSPQADRVAFQWRGPNHNDDIYVKLLDEEPPLRLTDDSASECCPAWSPDGQRIAFLRTSGAAPGIYAVPSLGGRERLLHGARPWFGSSLAWMPGGDAIVYSAAAEPGEARRVWLLSLGRDGGEGEVFPLTSPPATAIGDAFPSVSPDGRRVAFSRIEATGDLLTVADLYVTAVEDPEPRRLTHRAAFIGGLDWAPSGDELVFSTRNGPAVELWRVSARGGEATLLSVPWPNAIDRLSESPDIPSRPYRLSHARSTSQLALADAHFDLSVWRLPLPGLAPAEPLLASTFSDSGPSVSPDGAQIAFESRRSGASEIWTCDSDGTRCAALTRLGGHSGSPAWSPNGGAIAFDARTHDNADVYLLDVTTHRPQRLTTDEAEDVVPSWSVDGRDVYFSSDRSGRWEIWRKPADGDGPAVQVTRAGAFSSAESPDGRWLYHARLGEPGLWRLPADGGDSERVVSDVDCWGYWAIGAAGLYYVATALERPELRLLKWDAATPTPLGEVLELPGCGNRGLAVTPDEASLLLVRTDLAEGDLLLLDGVE